MYTFLRANKKNPKVSRFTVFHVMLAVFIRDIICIGWYLMVYFYFKIESIKDVNILRNWNKIHCTIKLSGEATGKTILINLSDVQATSTTKSICKPCEKIIAKKITVSKKKIFIYEIIFQTVFIDGIYNFRVTKPSYSSQTELTTLIFFFKFFELVTQCEKNLNIILELVIRDG